MCIYQRKELNKGRFYCSLGWYGGRPWIGNCIECLKRGYNTHEVKASFDAKSDRAHPANVKRIQGCCDRADQA
jgi:hypothetical protein